MDLGNWIQLYFATYSRKTLVQFAVAEAVLKQFQQYFN